MTLFWKQINHRRYLPLLIWPWGFSKSLGYLEVEIKLQTWIYEITVRICLANPALPKRTRSEAGLIIQSASAYFGLLYVIFSISTKWHPSEIQSAVTEPFKICSTHTAIELCWIRFLKNHDSDSLAILGIISIINSGILAKNNGKRIENRIIFRFTIPHFSESLKELWFTIPYFEQSTQRYTAITSLDIFTWMIPTLDGGPKSPFILQSAVVNHMCHVFTPAEDCSTK